MNTNLIGEQIAKFRKELGLTQEELGKAAGVSTQAVSRWECGGAPDVTLLPAIADRLGVTVDALFGREGGEVQDMTETLSAWLRTQPEQERLQKYSQLLWEASLGIQPQMRGAVRYPDSCKMQVGLDGEKVILHTVFSSEDGYILGVGGQDMSFMAVFPEPEGGYEQYLSENDDYRALFEVLSRPGSLEVMRWLCRQKRSYYVAAAVAKPLGLAVETCEELLSALERVHLLYRIELKLMEEVAFAYAMREQSGIVPFLSFAAWVSQANAMNYIFIGPRERSCLSPKEDKNEKK